MRQGAAEQGVEAVRGLQSTLQGEFGSRLLLCAALRLAAQPSDWSVYGSGAAGVAAAMDDLSTATHCNNEVFLEQALFLYAEHASTLSCAAEEVMHSSALAVRC